MKRRALDCAATIKSIVSVLKLIYTPTCTQAGCKKNKGGGGGCQWDHYEYWQDFPGAASFSQFFLR